MNKANRKFERMFPSLVQEERTYTNDLLADWRFVANWKRRLRQRELSDTINWHTKKLEENKNNTLKELLNIRHIYQEDEKTGDIFYFMPEEDANWNIIIDKKNRNIKFIDKKTGKIMNKKYMKE